MKNVFVFVVALVGLGLAAYWAMFVYGEIEGVTLSGHGVAAMIAGLVLTLVVGCGLMALLFFSNKHGHDERVHHLIDGAEDSDDK
jgi:hypothetical protein